jgi:hypothetical protein
MSNRWDNTLVTVKAGTRLHGWNHADGESAGVWVVGEDDFEMPTFRVVSAIACPTIHGGGSELVLAEVYRNGSGRITGDWRDEYTCRTHSCNVVAA